MICEICGRPIEDNLYIELVGEWTRRGTHKSCMRKRINKAFSDCIGTEDDDVGELVMDAIEQNLEAVAPLLPKNVIAKKTIKGGRYEKQNL